MCNPSLEPGGVSSAPETSALADVDADCEADTELWPEGAERPDQWFAVANGLL